MDFKWGGQDYEGTVQLPGIDSTTVVLVTGGSGAMGRRSAEAFLSLGARVAIMSRGQGLIDEVASELASGGEVLGIAGDISIQADCERVVSTVLDRWGQLDVLVHCAAMGGNSSIEELDAERIDRVLSANVKGALLMTKAVAVPMKAQGRGRIVMVSSIMGHRASPKSFLYGASKAALGHATRSLAVELGPSGITVNCISPASTPTQLRSIDDVPGTPVVALNQRSLANDIIPLRRRGQLDDYVGPILFFSSELSRYVTGADVLVDGGLSILRA